MNVSPEPVGYISAVVWISGLDVSEFSLYSPTVFMNGLGACIERISICARPEIQEQLGVCSSLVNLEMVAGRSINSYCSDVHLVLKVANLCNLFPYWQDHKITDHYKMVWSREIAFLQLSIKKMDTLKPYFQVFVRFKTCLNVG